MARDIVLDENNDLKIVAGDFLTGETEMQEVGLILQSYQGEWKENPMIGCNLVKEIRGNINPIKRERDIRVQMRLDGKSYDKIKQNITMK